MMRMLKNVREQYRQGLERHEHLNPLTGYLAEAVNLKQLKKHCYSLYMGCTLSDMMDLSAFMNGSIIFLEIKFP